MTPVLQTDATERVLGAGFSGQPLGLRVRVTMPGVSYVFHGIMEHFVGGEASIILDHSFLKGTDVHVEFDGFRFDGEVLFCEQKNGMYDTHVVIRDTDETGMRRDPRYVVNLPARLFARNTEQAFAATIVDISREGMGIKSAVGLEVGETVALVSQCILAFGIVRHCRQAEPGAYRAGLHVYNVISKEESTAPQPEKRHSFSVLFARRH